mgnify:CR=1 FL=1
MLSELSIISIEKELSENIDVTNIVKTYAVKKAEKANFTV